jgi:carboxylesterase
MHSGYFDTHIKPKNMFLVDGIVVSSIKTQSIANLIGPMLVFVETEQTTTEDSVWYRFRPQETVRELNELMKEGRKELESGVTAPAGTRVRIFHSKNDPTASSTSAVLLYKGLMHSDGSNIDIQMIDSDIHVFTRLALRSGVTSAQIANQQLAFAQMAMQLK